MKDSFMC